MIEYGDGGATRRGSPFLSGCGRLRVDTLTQSDGIQFCIGCLFLIEIGGEEANDLVMTAGFGPRDQCSVASDLIMFDRLAIGHNGSVEHGLVFDLASGFIGLFDDTIDGGACGSFRFLSQLLEGLLKAANLIPRFFQMAGQARLQIAVCRLVDHLRQSLRNLLLGVADVLQAMNEQIVKRLDVLRKDSHEFLRMLDGAITTDAQPCSGKIKGKSPPRG